MPRIFYKSQVLEIDDYQQCRMWVGNEKAVRHQAVWKGRTYAEVGFFERHPTDVEALDRVCDRIIADMVKDGRKG